MSRTNTFDQIFLWTTTLFAISIVLSGKFFQIMTPLWLLGNLVYLIKTRKYDFKLLVKKRVPALFIFYFLLLVFCLSFTENMKEGKFLIERFLLFILAPLTMLGIHYFPDKRKLLHYVAKGYIASCSFAILVCFGAALYRTTLPEFTSQILVGNFTYHKLASGLGLHAIYMGIYLVLGFFLALHLLQDSIHDVWKKILKIVVVVFPIFIFLLKSANVSFAFVLLLIYYGLNQGWHKKINHVLLRIIFFAISTAVVSIVFHKASQLSTTTFGIATGAGLFTAILAPWLISKLNMQGKLISPKYYVGLLVAILIFVFTIPQIDAIGEYAKEHPSNMTARYWNWKAAWELVASDPITGIGPGDAYDEIYNKYVEYDFQYGVTHRYNEHDQYLRSWLDTGILGLLTLLTLLYFMYRNGFKWQFFPLMALAVMSALLFITESALVRVNFLSVFVFFGLFSTFSMPLGKEEFKTEIDQIQ